MAFNFNDYHHQHHRHLHHYNNQLLTIDASLPSSPTFVKGKTIGTRPHGIADLPEGFLATVRYESTIQGKSPVLVAKIQGSTRSARSPILSLQSLPSPRHLRFSPTPSYLDRSSLALTGASAVGSSSITSDVGDRPPTMTTGITARSSTIYSHESEASPSLSPPEKLLNGTGTGPGTIPRITFNDDLQKTNSRVSSRQHDAQPIDHGLPLLTTQIPSGDLPDFANGGDVSFSNRGSVLIGGKRAKASALDPATSPTTTPTTPNKRNPSKSSIRSRTRDGRSRSRPSGAPSTRLLTVDEQQQSSRVRSMYEHGDPTYTDLEELRKLANPENGSVVAEEVPEATKPPAEDDDQVAALNDLGSSGTRASSLSIDRYSKMGNPTADRASLDRRRLSFVIREESELAGGFEDWKNIDGADVDRYGFIVPRQTTSPNGSMVRSPSIGGHQRVATALFLASETPRKRRTGTVRRRQSLNKQQLADSPPPPSSSAIRSASAAPASLPLKATPSLVSLRSGLPDVSPTMAKTRSASLGRPLRHRLPGSNRRLVHEAPDMLTLPANFPSSNSLASSNGSTTGNPSVTFAESPIHLHREIARQEKWRKMARSLPSASGSGMTFHFTASDPQLIERTWKGIPDRWRAAAWSSFLATSAAYNPAAKSDAALVDAFHALQERPCRDDGQIDLDVPRTISMHIMFMRRYRGGQRALFRVLHALALFKPQPGYVQGMASIVATLLCYFEEEQCFVVAVRLWEERGLGVLYGEGFGGLVRALADLDEVWLGRKDAFATLERLGVPSLSFGTKWYLTLFNYCIPFSAQLRVWDVFILLGDGPDRRKKAPQSQRQVPGQKPNQKQKPPSSSSGPFRKKKNAASIVLPPNKPTYLDPSSAAPNSSNGSLLAPRTKHRRWHRSDPGTSPSPSSSSPILPSRFSRSRSRARARGISPPLRNGTADRSPPPSSSLPSGPILPDGLPTRQEPSPSISTLMSGEQLPDDDDSEDDDDNDNAARADLAPDPEVEFGAQLDVLHATAAALVDGISPVLRGADFETCMKTVTSWIPVRDEDMLMRVALAEYRRCSKRKG